MSSPKRYSKGVTNVPASDPMGQLTFPDPTKTHVFFDDFNRFTAAEWTITTTEAAGSATEAIGDEAGGVLVVTNGTADDDNDFLQHPKEVFKLVSGKKVWFKTRFKISDVLQSDIIVGLSDTDTSPLDSSDGMFFYKVDGVATIDFKLVVGSVSSSAASIATLVNDTYVKLAVYYDGISTFTYFVDDVEAGTLASTTMPTAEIAPLFGIQNGETAAKIMNIDYLFVCVER